MKKDDSREKQKMEFEVQRMKLLRATIDDNLENFTKVLNDYSGSLNPKNERRPEAEIRKRKKALLSAKNENKRNCLHLACLSGAASLIEYICKEFKDLKLNIDQKDSYGYTPAFLACIHQRELYENISSERHIRSERRNQSIASEKMLGVQNLSKEILFLASQGPRVSILSVLLKHNTKLFQQKYNDKYNPLHWAIINGDRSLAEFIVKKKPKYSSIRVIA